MGFGRLRFCCTENGLDKVRRLRFIFGLVTIPSQLHGLGYSFDLFGLYFPHLQIQESVVYISGQCGIIEVHPKSALKTIRYNRSVKYYIYSSQSCVLKLKRCGGLPPQLVPYGCFWGEALVFLSLVDEQLSHSRTRTVVPSILGAFTGGLESKRGRDQVQHLPQTYRPRGPETLPLFQFLNFKKIVNYMEKVHETQRQQISEL